MNVTRDTRRLGSMVLAVLVLGVVIGVASGLLAVLLLGIERVAFGYAETDMIPGPFHVAPWRRVLSVVLGAAVAAVIWWLLRTRSTPVPSVTKAVNGERMPWWQTTVHVLLQIFIVGTGSSIGREVAPREFGAMIGQYYTRVMHLADVDRRMIVAVCAGAGLAGVYDAPLAGLFFAVELLLVDVTIEKVAIAFGTSAISAYIASQIRGSQVFYQLPGLQSHVTPSLMVFALVIGGLCGVAGAAFRKGSQWAQSGPRDDARLLWRMPLAALVTGLVATALPQVMGNGRAAGQLSFDTSLITGLLPGLTGLIDGRTATAGSSSSMWVLLAVLTLTLGAKVLTTLMTIRSGASGGVLQPGISLGATLGAIVGVVWVMVFPADSLSACALIGAAALLTASQQAPLMAMCLVMELCAAPIHFVVPVGAAVAVAALVSSRLLRGSAARLSRSERK